MSLVFHTAAGKYMSVNVRAYGMLRSMLGSDLTMELAVHSVKDLIQQLAAQYGEEVRGELLDEQGNLEHCYAILVGGRRVNNLSDKIKDEDEVVITGILAGG